MLLASKNVETMHIFSFCQAQISSTPHYLNSLSDMLRLVDAMLTQATSNKAFDVRVPLLDTTITKIIGMGLVFTEALYDFFVVAQPFDERGVKSLEIKG